MNENIVTTSCTTLFVGNLPFNIDEKEVEQLFGRHGRLKDVRLMSDRRTGKSLGYGFVEFEERKDAENVLNQMNNMECKGRRLRLNWSIGNDKKKQMGDSGRDNENERKYNDEKRNTSYSEQRHYLLGRKRERNSTEDSNLPRKRNRTPSYDSFNRIRTFYNQGKEEKALDEYFANPSPFSASFLIVRQNDVDMAFKIYQAAKENSSLDLVTVIELLVLLEKRKQYKKINSVCDDLMVLFHDMEPMEISKIKPFSWTRAIMALCGQERLKDVMELIDAMEQYKINLDNPFYTSLLGKCNGKEWIQLGKRIHELLAEKGKLDTILKSCLINMYGKCGCLEDALKIFDNMKPSERDIVSWATIILAYGEHKKGKEALELFTQMQREGVKPNDRTVSCILKACCESDLVDNAAELLFSMETQFGIKPNGYHYNCLLTACADKGLLSLGKKIHSHIIENNCEQYIVLQNNLMNMYGKCGCLDEAIKIFDTIIPSDRSIITWNIIIYAYAEHGKGQEALELFKQMQREGINPNNQTVTCVLKACCNSDLIDNAVEILFSMENRLGIKPDDYHYNCMLTACADKGLFSLGKKIHNYIIENNYPLNIITKNNLITMYGKCGHVDEAINLFEDIKVSERNIITWTAMISAYGENGKGKEALELFNQLHREGIELSSQAITCVLKACCDSDLVDSAAEIFFTMEKKLGVKPNNYQYNCMLIACADKGLLSLGEKIHNHILENNYPQSIIMKNNLINMYGKCGNLEEAIKIFNDIKQLERNVITWTTMISSYGQHGKGKEALSLFEQMQHEGIEPDDQTVTCVLNACSHSGLVQEALDIFSKLDVDFKIRPNVRHCNCVVDVLGRAGRLEEAEKFIFEQMKKYEIEPDIITWTALLGACRTYKDLERAEKIAQIIMDLNPTYASVYVLLSNIYAQSGNMENRNRLRELMDARGIKKTPGLSLVEVNDKVYRFVSEDNSHPNINEINVELEKLTEEMIKAGYNPDTSWITRDIESEEEKKELLCRHSEKLAMTWAMMKTESGTTIRITKNLRVCGDCHTATKFISKIRNREIIVRDASRYHHFKDGKCSCGDYW